MANNLTMLPVRQKQIVDKIKAAGLSPKDFEFRPVSHEEFSLTYKPIPSFIIGRVSNQNLYRFDPGPGGHPSITFQFKGFNGILEYLDQWFNAIKENISIGNPWEEIEEAKETMNNAAFDSYDDVFTAEDQLLVASKLDFLIEEFKKLEIDVESIANDLDHLKVMSGRISKKDWFLLLLGNITGWIFGGVIPAEVSLSAWEHVKVLFTVFKAKYLP